MRLFSLFLVGLVSIFSHAFAAEYSKREESNLFSFIKNRVSSKFEEYQENYQHFLTLMSALKEHFYDNYNAKPKGQYRLVKRESKRPRDLYILYNPVRQPIQRMERLLLLRFATILVNK
jgi:hypothetical protein